MGTAMTDKQNELIVRLRNLKLEGFASEIENQLSNLPVYAKLTFEDRLLSCVDIQETLNKEKRCFTLIKNAKFKDHLRLTVERRLKDLRSACKDDPKMFLNI